MEENDCCIVAFVVLRGVWSMYLFTIVNISAAIVAVLVMYKIHQKNIKIQSEVRKLEKQRNESGICDTCANLVLRCAPGDTINGYRYKCEHFNFDAQPQGCQYYKFIDRGYVYSNNDNDDHI